MTLPNLVSFSGYTEAGKDTAADIMVARARFVKTTMSKPLELALVQLNPWIVDHKENALERFEDLYENLGDGATKNFEEVRRLLQMLETQVGRENNGNIWFDQVFAEVGTLMGFGRKVALSGVKNLNELAEVREHGGVCVWVERPVKVRAGTYVNPEDCDVVVTNDRTPKDLYVSLVTALEEYTSNKEKDNAG